MVLGIMPTEEIVKLYQLKELYDLSIAVKRGDIKTFDNVILYFILFIFYFIRIYIYF